MFKFLLKTKVFGVLNKLNLPFTQPLMSFANTKIEVLPNGLKVATKEVISPLICTSIFVQCGPRYENSCNNGISNFIEHLISSNKDLQETVYSSCIKIDSTTTREYQKFSALSPIENMSQNIELVFKMISDLNFDNNDVEFQKNNICFEAFDYDQNPEAVVFDYLHQTAFQGTPLAQSVIGPSRNILEIDAEKICSFKLENYQPHRMFLAVSGGVPHEAMMHEVKKQFQSLRYTECQEMCSGPQRYTGSQIIYRDDSMPYTHAAIAMEVPGINSPEYLTLLVASYLTGSWERTQGGTINNGSPLARAASTSSLAEKFISFYIAYQDVGLWGIYFESDRMCLDDMVSNIQEQWMEMCTACVQTEVQRAVNLVKLELAKKLSGITNSCHNLGLQLLYKSEVKNLSELNSDLSKVTDKIIKDTTYSYIYDKCPAVAAIGPTEVFPAYTRIRSGMYWLRL